MPSQPKGVKPVVTNALDMWPTLYVIRKKVPKLAVGRSAAKFKQTNKKCLTKSNIT